MMDIDDILPNGAIVNGYCQIGSQGVVVAHYTGRPQPWVTWRVFDGDPKSTSWGHYFEDAEAAKADFVERIAGL